MSPRFVVIGDSGESQDRTNLPLTDSESLLEIIDQLTLARRSQIFFDTTS